jgi:dTDP-4-amino-4,6-dideoxygalactose transaminase
MPEIITLGQPTVGDEELAAVADVLRSGWLAGQGPTAGQFERRFAARCGSAHALAVANCTAALHLVFQALGAGRGDEVLVADYTFPATGHAVMYTGANPVFVDVRPDIWTVDPQAVEAAITSRTVGIAAVDAFGQPADYDELRAIASRHDLWLVEDAACAAGATYKGRPAGSLADAGCFSFHGRKGITSGEGGAITTDDAHLAATARRMHFFGIESASDRADVNDLPVPAFDALGYNYKLSEIAAAVISVQLDRLTSLVESRRAVAQRYGELLSDVDEITLPVESSDRTTVWQSYVLTLDPSVDRGTTAGIMRSRGVQCTIGTYASHLQPVYGERSPCPVSADLFRRHLAIPMHANLTDSQVETVAKTVLEAVRARP